MIVRVLKDLYKKSGDFALRDEFGNMMLKCAFVGKGYYIYNKRGIQIAQLAFGKNEASMAVAQNVPSYPGAVRIVKLGCDNFEFETNVIEKGDDQYTKNVVGRAVAKFSVWGPVSKYSYDIFDGSEKVGEVIPYPADDGVFQIRTYSETNILYVFMITLALEWLNAAN